ncbi:MAG TPA: 2-oxo acid dehydrogenase subunit E2, partial [Pyrinomonadaceae bacterium]|nr:2-oxo acid dehydrogenase subunit E2 [Pyrinomonadaceae bacterium]
MSAQQNQTDYSQFIAENFGANANYVETLLDRFRSDPSLVDESWRAYFAEMFGQPAAPPAPGAGATSGNGAPATPPPAPRADGNSVAATAPATAAATTHPAATSAPQSATAAPATTPQPAAQPAAQTAKAATPAPAAQPAVEAAPIRGAALKIVENMETSLSVPTATSNRQVPVKLLEENRTIINKHLKEHGGGKASYTHLIAYALLRALDKFPQLNDGFALSDGKPARLRRPEANLGVAIDIQKKDGTRSLLVPNVKGANALTFSQFVAAYDDVVRRARDGKLGLPDFQDTTISLTNPGTIGTVASTPRLMAGQSVIIATGAIEYPAEYHAMTPEALSQLGISKTLTISSTYDHRIIQGAESGAFLAHVHELLIGKHDFYESIFHDLGISYTPMRWSVDRNPALLGGDRTQEQIVKQARVLELI